MATHKAPSPSGAMNVFFGLVWLVWLVRRKPAGIGGLDWASNVVITYHSAKNAISTSDA